MGLMAEISAWFRFAFRTPESAKKIVFYSEQASYWAYLEGVVNAIQKESESEFCYVTSDAEDPILTRRDPQIHAFYLKTLLPYFMLLVKCRVFVMTLTELNQHHLRRSIHPVHYVYLFHSLISTHMAYRRGAFDHYDSILCCGPYQVDEIRRQEALDDLPKKELIEGGYYRLERIYAASQEHSSISAAVTDETQVRSTSGGEKRRVLVAPSWAANNVLEEHGILLAETLVGAGYEVIMRPHPETLKRDPKRVEEFAAHFEGDDRVTLERSVASDDSLLSADALITDWSGIAQEYAFGTERPVLYLDVPRKIHNDRYAEIEIEPFEVMIRSQVGLVFSPNEIAEIDQAINELIGDREKYRAQIRTLRDANLFCFGKSGEVGARHILEVAARPIPT